MTRHRLTIACGCCTALWVLGGCGGNSQGLYAVSGSVNVDGAPLEKGNLSLQPTEKQPTTSGAVISAGKFSIPRDKGLAPGKYRVVINAAMKGEGGKIIPADAMPGEPPPPAREMIPKEWNTASEHTIEVTPKGPFVFPFEISTKGK